MTTIKDRMRFTLRLPCELLERVKKEAEKQHITTNAKILEILWKHVENKGA